MKLPKTIAFLFFTVVFFLNAAAAFSQSHYEYAGRVEVLPKNQVALIGPASSVSFEFSGKDCEIILKNASLEQNYIALELDGQYLGRFRIEGAQTFSHNVKVDDPKKQHRLSIFKATESNIGDVIFIGTNAKTILPKSKTKRRKIEFIGDSLTCGQGNDTTQTACDQGKWYDKHNAYFSYAAVAARELNVDFILNSVSGMGMYRNWNTEYADKQSMPDVYENLRLNKGASKKYDFSFKPDIISIGIGNNDYYLGGNSRKPFEADKFVSAYVDFVNMLYQHNSKVTLVFVSAILEGQEAKIMDNCLAKIKAAFPQKNIKSFKFPKLELHGCDSHPSKADHQFMADAYVKFMKNEADFGL